MEQIKLQGLDEVIYKDTCENGLEIYIWKNSKVNTFKCSLVIKVGAEDTSFKIGKTHHQVLCGTHHYLEHIMCKDNEGNSLISKYNELGCHANASTWPDKTVYEIMGSNNISESLELLLNNIQEKTFDEKSFESERNPILEESRMRKDDAGRLALYGMNECLFKEYPNRTSGLGTENDILNISLDDLRLIYETFYHPKNSCLVITGNVEPIEIIHIVKENQKNKTFLPYQNPIRTKYKEPKKVVKEQEEIYANIEIPSVHVAVKIPKKAFGNIEIFSLLPILNLILASNFGTTSLFRENILEHKIAVSLGSGAYLEKDYIIIKVSSKTKYPEEMIPRIKEKLNHLEINWEDIERKIKSEIATLVLGYEDVEEVNDMLCYYLVKYEKIIENEKEILENINLKKVEEVCQNISLKEMSILTMYPLKKKKAD